MMSQGSDYADFSSDTLLKEILMHPRLAKDKFGSYPSKYVKIGYGYYASRAFLEMLLDTYGDISFREAYIEWENDKK